MENIFKEAIILLIVFPMFFVITIVFCAVISVISDLAVRGR